MKSQHTPGPWTAWGCTIYTDSGYRVAQTWDQDRCCLPTPTMEADARLIASAPELLASLVELEAMVSEMLPKHGPCGWGELALNQARESIAKAKGGVQ